MNTDMCTFMIIFRSVLLKKIVMIYTQITENINTHFVFDNTFFPKNRAVYGIMWKKLVERGRVQMAIWCMRVVCW